MQIVVAFRHDVIAVSAGILRILLFLALDQSLGVAIVNATQPVSVTKHDREWNLKAGAVQSLGRCEAPLATHPASKHLE